MQKTRRTFSITAVLLTATIAGCAGAGNSTAQDNPYGAYTDPAKFTLYPCPALQQRAREVADRQRELEELMAKAGNDAGGRLINTLAYRNEYFAVRGEMIEIQKAAAHKSCPPIATDPTPRPPLPATRSPARAGGKTEGSGEVAR